MKRFPARQGVPGFRFGATAAGIKKPGVRDLGLILCDTPCTAAGVFTRNRVKAAPVLVARQRLRAGTARALLANSGNANACTGARGRQDALATCRALAAALHIPARLTLPCSTGVIGVPLPVARIEAALPALINSVAPTGISDFADAILTTDTTRKIVAVQDTIGGRTVKLCGIAKGSGMIMPDMATMLAFFVTDAALTPQAAGNLLTAHTAQTFNRISVDGDMSTNDSAILLAGGTGPDCSRPGSAAGGMFESLLQAVMSELARMIVRDGEGATKLITVSVIGARSDREARNAAAQVGNSCLVKTAFFGEDFNWGRIMAALGSSGARFSADRVELRFNRVTAVRQGQGVPQNYPRLRKIMKDAEIELAIDLQAGSGRGQCLTCDLSYDYVRINAEYTS